MNIFNLDDDVKALLVRIAASLENLDNALAEYQLLAAEARKELAAWRATREKLLK